MQYPSGDAKETVGCVSLELRDGPDKEQLRCFGDIKII
jgi:hypothetical protein